MQFGQLLAEPVRFVKEWPELCLLLMCKEGLKTAERRRAVQTSFLDVLPTPALRAVKITVNEAAKEKNIKIFPNMRVPECSIIHAVHKGETEKAEALEDLSWWRTSSGEVLPDQQVSVKAKNSWSDTYALIIPRLHNTKSSKHKS